MSRGTNSILSEIEWDEGLSMPVANAENKALEDQVKPLKNAYVAIVGCIPLPPPPVNNYRYDFVIYIT